MTEPPGNIAHIVDADGPKEFPPSSWRAILWRLWLIQSETGLWVMASGVAFYAVLAVLPGLGFTLLTLGMISGADRLKERFEQLKGIVPEQALVAFVDQLAAMVGNTGGTLRWGITGSLLLMLWSLWLGMRALIAALNFAYRETERRGFFALNGLSLLLGLVWLGFVPLTFGVFLETATLAAALRLPEGLLWMLQWLRWPFLTAMILLVLALLYRVGPCRTAPKWRWVSWGAVVAGTLWIVASALFTAYVQHVTNYQAAYGLAGAVITLMLWLNLIAYAILLGGALNAEMERQTTRETISPRHWP
ncbi:YihY/virulence factor BrkB family protein [Azospirillum brasilense]|uniref:YihY/virulence factor BrkB family protein n=1 Tax=Azospirillum brasilense TaxID=192 RepID=A0A235H747_AZOBR|nr:YihY/virulence factor BrkB family protein [Azospirillum brasilense]OYD81598.1 hypothetical protein CHT98_25025 [Azospirillum brasilense]